MHYCKQCCYEHGHTSYLVDFLLLAIGINPEGFPCGSACEESACNVGDLGLIPVLGRSPGEGKVHGLYSP